MYATSKVKSKLKAEVEVTMSDGRTFKGNFYINAQERVLDVLNDERTFLPFLGEDDAFTVLNKAYITSIVPLQSSAQQNDGIPAHLVDRR